MDANLPGFSDFPANNREGEKNRNVTPEWVGVFFYYFYCTRSIRFPGWKWKCCFWMKFMPPPLLFLGSGEKGLETRQWELRESTWPPRWGWLAVGSFWSGLSRVKQSRGRGKWNINNSEGFSAEGLAPEHNLWRGKFVVKPDLGRMDGSVIF